jgi:hypothetical protein
VLVFVVIDLVSALLLLSALYLVWNERKEYHSIGIILPSLALVTLGRFCDVLLEHPSLRQANPFALSPATYEVLFAALGNIADALGIFALIFGFVRIIKHERASAQFIYQLESFLPICSYCRKYRTDDDKWLPIEKYLKENTGRTLTHGICPDCNARIRAEHFGRRPSLEHDARILLHPALIAT